MVMYVLWPRSSELRTAVQCLCPPTWTEIKHTTGLLHDAAQDALTVLMLRGEASFLPPSGDTTLRTAGHKPMTLGIAAQRVIVPTKPFDLGLRQFILADNLLNRSLLSSETLLKLSAVVTRLGQQWPGSAPSPLLLPDPASMLVTWITGSCPLHSRTFQKPRRLLAS